jgi:hypothetical protein
MCRDSGIRFENRSTSTNNFRVHITIKTNAMTMQSTGAVLQVFLLLALLSFQGVDSFQGQSFLSNSCLAKKYALQPQSQRHHSRRPFRLHISENDDDAKVENDASVSPKGDFDGAGFVNYLAPYALALLGSIAVTAAFLKFVLLDY